jgi:BirA family biotin operon repressor/biotin-[acetyl-CoA-carboxylase] ligase
MKSINLLTHQWAEKNNIPSFFENEIDSTNSWAKREFKDASLSLYTADHQTQGRGRQKGNTPSTWTNSSDGRTWLSTWSLRTPAAPQPIFTVRVGLALYESFSHAWPQLPFALKAPNDIYLHSGKLSGILVEAEQTGEATKIFIGIGANIFAHPGDVGQTAASLSEHAQCTDEEWFNFCFHLHREFLNLQKDAHRSTLTTDEQKRLLAALKKHTGNTIRTITAEGSLILNTGESIPWHTL